MLEGCDGTDRVMTWNQNTEFIPYMIGGGHYDSVAHLSKTNNILTCTLYP